MLVCLKRIVIEKSWYFIFRLDNPELYRLPKDYIYTRNRWGTVFYKIFGAMDYLNAKEKCQIDGASGG